MAAYRRVTTHATCRLTAKNRDLLRNPALGNRVWATFTFLQGKCLDGLPRSSRKNKAIVRWAFLGLWALPGNRFTRVGAQLHSTGVWFEEQSTHTALGRLPFVSLHLLPDVQLVAAPTARRWDTLLGWDQVTMYWAGARMPPGKGAVFLVGGWRWRHLPVHGKV